MVKYPRAWTPFTWHNDKILMPLVLGFEHWSNLNSWMTSRPFLNFLEFWVYTTKVFFPSLFSSSMWVHNWNIFQNVWCLDIQWPFWVQEGWGVVKESPCTHFPICVREDWPKGQTSSPINFGNFLGLIVEILTMIFFEFSAHLKKSSHSSSHSKICKVLIFLEITSHFGLKYVFIPDWLGDE